MGRKRIHFNTSVNNSEQIRQAHNPNVVAENVPSLLKKRQYEIVSFIDTVLDEAMTQLIRDCLQVNTQKLCQIITFEVFQRSSIKKSTQSIINELKVLVALKESQNQFLSGQTNIFQFSQIMSHRIDLGKNSIMDMLGRLSKMNKLQLQKHYKQKTDRKVKILNQNTSNLSKTASPQNLSLNSQNKQTKTVNGYFQDVVRFLKKIQDKMPLLNHAFEERFQQFIEIKRKNQELARQSKISQQQVQQNFVLQEDLFIISILKKFKKIIQDKKTDEKDIDAVISLEICRNKNSINKRIKSLCYLKPEDLVAYIEKGSYLCFQEDGCSYYFNSQKETIQTLIKLKNQQMIKRLRNFIKIKKTMVPLSNSMIQGLKQIYHCNQDIQKSSFIPIQLEQSFIGQVKKPFDNFLDQIQVITERVSHEQEQETEALQQTGEHKRKLLQTKICDSYKKEQFYHQTHKRNVQNYSLEKMLELFERETSDSQTQTCKNGENKFKDINKLIFEHEDHEKCEIQQYLKQRTQSKIVKKKSTKIQISSRSLKQTVPQRRVLKQLKFEMPVNKMLKDYQDLQTNIRLIESIFMIQQNINKNEDKTKSQSKAFQNLFQMQQQLSVSTISKMHADNTNDQDQNYNHNHNFRYNLSSYLKNVINSRVFDRLKQKLACTTDKYLAEIKNSNSVESTKNQQKVFGKILHRIRAVSLPIMLKEIQKQINDPMIPLNFTLKQLCNLLQLNVKCTSIYLFELTSLDLSLQVQYINIICTLQLQYFQNESFQILKQIIKLRKSEVSYHKL